MPVELTRTDPFFILLNFAFAFWMRRRPEFFAGLFSVRWLRRLLIGRPIVKEHSQRNPSWLISLFSWVGLLGIWGAIVEMGIWLALVAAGCRVY